MSIEATSSLSAPDAEAVLAIAEQARRSDGTAPLSESVLLRVHGGAATEGVEHLLLRGGGSDGSTVAADSADDTAAGGRVLGYANLDTRSAEEPASAELFIAPAARRRGQGGALLAALQLLADQRSGIGYAVWAHGKLPAAAALAKATGMQQSRVLWQLRRGLPLETDNPGYRDNLPEGVRIRPFVVGQDEDAWLAVNAAAFSDHPEQGRLQRSDLDERIGEDWFDAAGFLLAERESDGELLGFHWTKVHREEDPVAGEVYVVGVSPAAQGMRLGVVLTVAGLDYLAGTGLGTVLLYVDDSNPRAVQLYRNLGFTDHSTDIMYTPASRRS